MHSHPSGKFEFKFVFLLFFNYKFSSLGTTSKIDLKFYASMFNDPQAICEYTYINAFTQRFSKFCLGMKCNRIQKHIKLRGEFAKYAYCSSKYSTLLSEAQ